MALARRANYNWRGFYYVLNQKNDNPGTITVNWRWKTSQKKWLNA